MPALGVMFQMQCLPTTLDFIMAAHPLGAKDVEHKYGAPSPQQSFSLQPSITSARRSLSGTIFLLFSLLFCSPPVPPLKPLHTTLERVSTSQYEHNL